MRPFPRLLTSEFLKLRRSAALRVTLFLPLLFLLIEFWVFERPALGQPHLSPRYAAIFDTQQIKLVGTLWAGFFHPLMLALLPALLFRPEHRFKTWRHLQTMPASRRTFFLAKGVALLLLFVTALIIVGLGLWVERTILGRLNPAIGFPFHAFQMTKVLGWLLLGSLPLLALYLWVSDRINSLAVPIVFGLLGMILTISLSGQDVTQPWKRDLIPWVLSYFCAQRAMDIPQTRQDVHVAGTLFQVEPNIIRLPNGKRVRTWQPVPDDVLFPPPAPTPTWILGIFSLGAGAALLGLGLADAKRNRI